MDRRVKERLVGASILVLLIVLIVPELLSGPQAPEPVRVIPGLPVSPREPVRNVTVDLATSKAPAPESGADAAAASSVPPQEKTASPSSPPAPPPAASPRAAPSAPLETAPPPPTSATTALKPAAAGRAWAVQLGSFAGRANADKLVRQLRPQGFSVYLLPGGSGSSLRYRVRVGPMADRGAATQAAAKLKSLGYSGSLVPPAP
jgi:DedD protein